MQYDTMIGIYLPQTLTSIVIFTILYRFNDKFIKNEASG